MWSLARFYTEAGRKVKHKDLTPLDLRPSECPDAVQEGGARAGIAQAFFVLHGEFRHRLDERLGEEAAPGRER